MITKTDAVVLHARKFRESSMIVTLYTREHGKMSVIARGATRMKSKFGATLQPMACVSAMIYMKEGRELQNLSDAESNERLFTLTDSLETIAAGLSIIELVNATVHEGDRNDMLFDALVDSIRMLNRADTNETGIVLWFMIRLADALGYAIRTEECGVCEEPVAWNGGAVSYSVATGAPLCAEHRESMAYRRMSAGAFDMLRQLRHLELEDAAGIVTQPPSASELHDALTAFIRFHVEGLRRLNVGIVSMKVLGDPSSAQV